MTIGLAAVIERLSRRFLNSTAAPRPPIRVLIVDDEASIRNFVARVVGGAGFEITTASNATEALAIAMTHSFDLLLTDLMMPEMYGDELARRLRTTNPGLPVLYLTGFSDLLFKEDVILSEGEGFLDKPCTIKGLLQAVNLALSGGTKGQHCHG
jgi:two-component system cell cycle sensor histidine kinase/response regulator CckA